MTAPTAPRAAVVSAALPAAEMPMAVARGALVLDVRTRAQRAAQGVLPGALAVAADQVPVLLDTSGPGALSAARQAPEVLLVGDDGIEAELLAWRIAELGVRARAVSGGFAALSSARLLQVLGQARHLRRERTSISAH